jgi:hydroxymethylpyrimidine/phosphomethylpyrimidine kinase
VGASALKVTVGIWPAPAYVLASAMLFARDPFPHGREILLDLNQVTIPSNDYDASVTFYKALGCLQIVDSPPRYARFETKSGTTFSIHAANSDSSNPDFILYFEVDNVNGTVDQLKDRGLVFDEEPSDKSWLWREAYLRDPSGNVICIYHAGENRRYPPWRVKDDSV